MKKLLLAIPLLASLLVACPDPVTPPPATTIGASGGTVTSSNTKASVTFPAGALTTDTAVTITENTNPPAVASTQKIIPGTTFTVGGGTGNFASSAALKIKLSPSEIAALGFKTPRTRAIISDVIALQYNGTTWITISYTFDTNTNTLTISIPGYGTFSLVVPNAPAPGALSSIALSCNPTSIAVAATSTCTAIGKDSSNTALTTQPTFTFNSSDTGKATVSSVGKVTGVAAGSSNITASSSGLTSNAVAVTVTAAPSGGSVTIISTNQTARGKAISANGRVFFTTVDTQVTGNQFGFVYDGTTSTALPALPSGYTSISFDVYARPCINSNGDVAYIAYKTGRINHALYYDKTANSVSEIPFGDNNFVFGCNDAKQVVASEISNGGKHFKWQANDASATQLSRLTPNSVIGYRALDINDSGAILFPDGILKGTTFTPIVASSGAGLTNAGTVYGVVGLRQLYKMNEGDAEVTLLGTPPGQIQDLSLAMLGVNNNGDVLLRATGLASSTDYQYWLYKNGVYSRITVPNYTILEAIGISDDDSVLVNVYNSENFGGNYRVALVKP
jgi:hypothetical protein